MTHDNPSVLEDGLAHLKKVFLVNVLLKESMNLALDNFLDARNAREKSALHGGSPEVLFAYEKECIVLGVKTHAQVKTFANLFFGIASFAATFKAVGMTSRSAIVPKT